MMKFNLIKNLMLLSMLSAALSTTGCNAYQTNSGIPFESSHIEANTLIMNMVKNSARSQTENSPEVILSDSDEYNLTVDYIDVGQGDAELLRSNGKSMLIDTGTPESGTAIRLFLKKHNVDKLDYLVLTHPDADHIGGAASVITNVTIGTVLMPDCAKDNKTYDGVIDALSYKSITPHIPDSGEAFSFGSCDVKILGPARRYDDANNNSISLKVTCGDTGFIFIGDAEEEELADITAMFGNELDSDVYKVGHHGSYNSSTQEFLEKVTPKYSVISCEEGNSYGHPHSETLTRLRSLHSHVLRTDLQGTITISSDGKTISCDPYPCDDFTPGENTQSSLTTMIETYEEPINIEPDSKYVKNTNSMKFHRATCESVGEMSEKNKEFTNESREEIIKEGYTPCKACRP